MFRVRIASLPDGLHQETHRPTADALGLDPEVFSDVEVDLRLDVADRRVLVAYTVRASARLECDRTLEMYDQPVEADHAVLFTADALDEGDDEVLPLSGDALEIDLTAPVHDTLLLALPLRRVSPAAEAADLPTAFGAADDDDDAPVDSRWAALQALRSAASDGDPDSSD